MQQGVIIIPFTCIYACQIKEEYIFLYKSSRKFITISAEWGETEYLGEYNQDRWYGISSRWVFLEIGRWARAPDIH